MKSSVKQCWLVALALVLVVTTARAAEEGPRTQPIAWVVGSVLDEAGHPIAGATISVIDSRGWPFTSGDGEKGRSMIYLFPTAVTSNQNGKFSIGVFFEGTYRVRASAPGFAPVTLEELKVTPLEIVSVEIRLAPEANSSLLSLGTIRVNGSQSVSHASAPSVSLDPQDLAGQGIEQLSDVLSQQVALTMTRPAGGAPGLPQSAALRGPDPSETVIDIDGHQINNANTGDFDLSLLDPSEFQSVQVVYGIGPSSLVGANTQGGAINFRTIDPTKQQHGLLRFSAGSFNTFSGTLQATGTSQRYGYALSLHRYTSNGQVNNYRVTDDRTRSAATIGSTILADSSLAKLRYTLGSGDGFIEATYRNIVAFRDLSAPLAVPDSATNITQNALFTVLPDASAQTIAPAFGIDLQLPLGSRKSNGATTASLIARHEASIGSQTVPSDVEALGNPYLFNQRDRVVDDSIQYNHDLDTGSLTLAYDVRRETLTAAAALAPGPPAQSQAGRSFVGRYDWRPGNKLALTAAAYASMFDTFGRSIDPRLAAVWTPTPGQVYRASIGTAFRAPLLAERVFNPALTAERTTEYELGYERRFGDGPLAARGVLNLYWTSLRSPIFFTTNATGGLTFLANLGDVVYKGVELRMDKALNSRLAVRAAYGVSIAYPINNPFAFDPAAPNVVAGQQFQGIPPRKAQLSFTGRGAANFNYFVSAAYESTNNELNRPQYATVAAGVSKTFGHTHIALTGRNITNQYSSLFTLANAGTSYPTPAGPAATNAYSLQGAGVTLTLTQFY